MRLRIFASLSPFSKGFRMILAQRPVFANRGNKRLYLSLQKPTILAYSGVRTTRPNDKLPRCTCGFLEDQAEMPDSPISFDHDLMNTILSSGLNPAEKRLPSHSAGNTSARNGIEKRR